MRLRQLQLEVLELLLGLKYDIKELSVTKEISFG